MTTDDVLRLLSAYSQRDNSHRNCAIIIRLVADQRHAAH